MHWVCWYFENKNNFNSANWLTDHADCLAGSFTFRDACSDVCTSVYVCQCIYLSVCLSVCLCVYQRWNGDKVTDVLVHTTTTVGPVTVTVARALTISFKASSQSSCRTRRCVTSSWLPSTPGHVTFVAVRPVTSVLMEVMKQPVPPGPIIHLTALIITQLNSNEVINIAHRILFIVRDGVD